VEVVKKNGLDGQGKNNPTSSTPSTLSKSSTKSTKLYPEFSANAVLVLLAVACVLLDRQVERLARDFENEGGFTERLYRIRSKKRRIGK
jgi:four helix bundle suffix protein